MSEWKGPWRCKCGFLARTECEPHYYYDKNGHLRTCTKTTRKPYDRRAPDPEKQGSWPAMDLRRAFVEGAKWWCWEIEGATMWPSDVNRAEQRAEEKYPGGYAPDPKKQELVDALRKVAYPGPFFNDDVRDARALLCRYNEEK